MRFTIVILSALFCLQASAETSIEKSSDEALLREAEKLVGEISISKAAEATPATMKDAASTAAIEATSEKKVIPESQIPVLTETSKTAKAEGSLIWRLVASIGLIGVVAVSLVFGIKKMGHKKNIGGAKSRIETLHQVHFGPRKSLALVRIAGEVLLLGMTDQSITMLKSVVLIDEELENTMNTDFNKFLNDDFAMEDIRSAISNRA